MFLKKLFELLIDGNEGVFSAYGDQVQNPHENGLRATNSKAEKKTDLKGVCQLQAGSGSLGPNMAFRIDRKVAEMEG